MISAPLTTGYVEDRTTTQNSGSSQGGRSTVEEELDPAAWPVCTLTATLTKRPKE